MPDPKKAARAAGLHYGSDREAGIGRRGKPGHFRYYDSRGRPVRDRKTLARIATLAVPPAWTDVWIASSAHAHLQATGRDARGRKQYRYHAAFAAVRDAAKYMHLEEFATALPLIRKRLKRDLNRPGLPREKVMAATVALLEETLIRIGNEDYARANASFGLTTLRNRHVQIRGDELRFLFKGKSGKQWRLSVHDRRVAKILRSCQELPGQHLLEYRDAEGQAHTISSSDVNGYLRAVSHRDVTAKDFRTWAGTVKAARGFHAIKRPASKTVIKEVVAAVASELGNTASVCRKCYIHPAIITAFEGGGFSLRIPRKGRGGLTAIECAVLALLRRKPT